MGDGKNVELEIKKDSEGYDIFVDGEKALYSNHLSNAIRKAISLIGKSNDETLLTQFGFK